ncbi:MAG: nicotinate (nicotinamide) nucleotide adenylyltransferase [Kiritimatiellae bacterium]|nr:nicotinate (nicotinamide) nucleotide adenylyltransferase [Kiritimatiellia bacterium]
MMRRIGIFGGSFNPVHNGHIRVALAAARDCNLDKVFAIPAHVSPFKTSSPPWPDAFRLELVRIAFAPFAPLLEVSAFEIERACTSYAIDTVRHFKALYPGAEIFFIIGEDSLAGLPRWKDWTELQRLAHFKAYPRTFESSTEIRRRLASGEDISGFVPAAIIPKLAAFAAAEQAKAAPGNG